MVYATASRLMIARVGLLLEQLVEMQWPKLIDLKEHEFGKEQEESNALTKFQGKVQLERRKFEAYMKMKIAVRQSYSGYSALHDGLNRPSKCC